MRSSLKIISFALIITCFSVFFLSGCTSFVNPEYSSDSQNLIATNELLSDYVEEGFYYDGKPLSPDSIFVAGSNGIVVDSFQETSFGSYKGVTHRIKLDGAMDQSFNNSIKFRTTAPCTLIVYAKSASGFAFTRAGYVLNYWGDQVDQTSAPFSSVGSPSMATFYLPSAGTYYFGGNKNAINVYYIGISYQTNSSSATASSSYTKSSSNKNTSSITSSSSSKTYSSPNYPETPSQLAKIEVLSSDVLLGTYFEGEPLLPGSIFVAGPGTRGVDVDSSSAVSFGSYTGVTNRMKLGGLMDNTFKNSIKFTTEFPCTLTVYAKSGSSADPTRCGYVLDSNGQQVGEVSAPFAGSGSPTMATFPIPGAGTYYFGGNVKSINVYYISIS